MKILTSLFILLRPFTRMSVKAVATVSNTCLIHQRRFCKVWLMNFHCTQLTRIYSSEQGFLLTFFVTQLVNLSSSIHEIIDVTSERITSFLSFMFLFNFCSHWLYIAIALSLLGASLFKGLCITGNLVVQTLFLMSTFTDLVMRSCSVFFLILMSLVLSSSL